MKHNAKASVRSTLRLLGLCAMMALLAGVCLAQNYAFDLANVGTGVNPQAVANADLNGDTKPDIITSNFNDGTISVFIANTDGSYQARVNYTVGSNPIAIATGDFNGDGKRDVIVVNSNCPTLPCAAVGSFSILAGNGDGTLQTHVDVNLGHFPAGVTTLDFNGDGKLDLTITNSQDNTVSVFQGLGNNTFKLVRNLATGVNPNGVIACACHGGTVPDLVVANTTDSTISWFKGNGDGTFRKPLLFSTGLNPTNLVTADYNNDGRPDVMSVNSGAATASILLNSTDGGFEPFVDFPTGGLGFGIAQGDVDGDGNIDIIVTSPTNDLVSYLRSLGNGTFAAPINYAAGLDPVAITAVDFTGDGRLDLAVTNDVDNTVSILANAGGTYTTRTNITVGNMPNGLATGDFDGDGNIDMAVADRSDNLLLILKGKGDGTFTNTGIGVTTGNKPSSVIAVDLNKDGILDLVSTNANDNNVSVALGLGAGVFGAARTAAVGTRPVAVVARDFNNDGKMDLAVCNQNSLTVSILIGNGDGTFQPQKSYTTGSGSNPAWMDAGPLVGTRQSIVTANNGTGTISVLLNNGDGTFTLPVQYTAGTGPSGIALADLNGDGNLDVAVTNQTSATVSVLTGNGNGTFNPKTDYTVPKNPFFVAIADVSGDGKADLVVGTSIAVQNRVSILPGNGDGTFRTHQDHTTKVSAGGPSEALAIADFNNDGSLDIAAADQVGNDVAIFVNTAVAVLAPQSVNFGTLGIGQPSPPAPITFTNAGSAGIDNLVVSTTGDYSQSNNCGATVTVGANCVAQVTFTATQSGTRSGTLAFSDNVPGSPQNATLTGVGSGPGATLSTTQLTFPNTIIGQTSIKQVVNLTNTGSVTLTITSIVSNSSQYQETNTCGTTLGVGLTCTIFVSFKPTQSGVITGAIVITDNAPTSPQMVALTGVGTNVKLLPIKLFFGNQKVGTSSAPQSITVTNVGSATLNISGITLVGTDPQDYSQTNNCPSGLVGGASCAITVTFKPTATGDRPATVSISDDGGGSPQTAPVDGTGT